MNLTFVKDNKNLVDKLAQLFINDDDTITFGSPYHTYVWEGEEIDTTSDDYFCGVGIPNDVRGSFTVYRDDDGERKYFFNRAVPDDLENDPNWGEYDFGIIECNVKYYDLENTDDIEDGDEIVFAFMVDGQVYDDLSETYKFEKGDGYVRFNSIEHHDEPFWNPNEVKADNPDEVVLRIFDFPEDIDAVFYLIISKDNQVVKNITFERWDDDHWVDYYVDKDDEDWSPNKRYLIKVKDLEDLPCDEYNFKVQFTRNYIFDENMDYDVGTIAVVPFVVNINNDEEEFSDILNYIFEIEVPEDGEGSASLYVDGSAVYENKALSEIQYIDYEWRNGYFIRLNDLAITTSGEHDIQLNVTYNGNTRIIQTRKNIAVGENVVTFKSVNNGDSRYVDFYLQYPMSADSVLDLYLNNTKSGNVSIYDYIWDRFAPLYSNELEFKSIDYDGYIDDENVLDVGKYNGAVKNGDDTLGEGTFSVYDFYIYLIDEEFDIDDNKNVIEINIPEEFFNEHGNFYILAHDYQNVRFNKTITELTNVHNEELGVYVCSLNSTDMGLDDTGLFYDWDILKFSFVYNYPPKYEEWRDDVEIGYELSVKSYYKLNILDHSVIFREYDEESERHLFIRPNTILLNQDEDYNSSTWVARLYIDDYKASGSLVMTVWGSEVVVFDIPFENVELGDNQHGEYGFNVGLDEMDLSGVQDKDILELTFNDGSDEPESIFVSVQRTDSFIRFYVLDDYDPEESWEMEFHTFYRNLTDGDYDVDMAYHFYGKFITVDSPTQIDDLTVTIKSDDGQFEKVLSLNEFTYDDYEYDSRTYAYSYAITDELKGMPDGNFTVTYNCNGQEITHKRNKAGDWVSVIITPDDVAEKFDITVNDKLSDENDVALSIIATEDANRHTIGFDLGYGYFSVYVNGTRLENLGTLVPWVEPEEDDEDGYKLVRIDLPGVTELELFRLCTDNAGCPEVYFTLADLGITQPGTYNIKITHYPSVEGGWDYHENNGYGEPSGVASPSFYITETELINKDIVFDNSNATIEISAVNSDVVITLASGGSPIADADIIYSLNGGSEVDATTDGNGQVTVAAPEGDVLVNVTYSGRQESKTLYFRVSTGMVIASSGNDVIITLTDAFGNKVAGAGITYRLNNADKVDAATDANGQVIITPLEGTVKVIGSFAGTVSFKASSAVETLTLPIIPAETTLTIAKGNASAVITLTGNGTPMANVNITYSLNDVENTTSTDENGTVTLTDLTGEATIVAKYLGSDAFKPSNVTAVFDFNATSGNATTGNGTGGNTNPGGNTEPGNNTNPNQNTTVEKVKTTLSAASITMTYTYSGALVATLKDENGNAVSGATITFNFGNAVYNITTDSEGNAVRTIGLAPKVYTVNIAYAGNDTYVGSSATAKVTVYKATPVFTAKAQKFKASTKTKKYTVTLKSNGKVVKNAPLTLKINGKTFKATTNSKGQATFKMTKLTKKGTFNAKVKFVANSFYKSVTKTVKITIK
ncbi:MAG: hypothetical protein IJ122_04530 [Methanobrevibacter sp.]|nr:hypothetical protein [Methanobrevibacter sp.]